MTGSDWQAVFLTLQLAAISTGILLVIGIPMAWWISRMQSRFKVVLESIIALPIVLPPTVLGFYLLIMFSPNSAVGSAWVSITGSTLAFSFTGIVLGSVIYSLPFVVQPIQSAMEQMQQGYWEAAGSLGANKIDRFFTLVLPMVWKGLLIGAGLGFAHTLGEFGVVLMIGGNLPGETRVLSIAIFEHVEAFEYERAHWLSAVALILSFTMLVLLYSTQKQSLWVKK